MINFYPNPESLKKDIPKNKSITLVGGCFDLLHVGHLHLFDFAKKLEDLLIVAVLSDNYVKSYKGIVRPVIGQEYRAHLVAALKPIDYVYISDKSPNEHEALSLLQPHSLVFGADNDEKNTKPKKSREKYIKSHFPKIKIYFLERFSDYSISTSNIIQKIKKL